MAVCPCGKEIESWEAVCSECWRALGKYDSKFGSNLRESILSRFQSSRRRDVLNREMLEVIKERIINKRTWRISNLKVKMRNYCIACEREKGPRDIDDCFNCSFHILVNRIFEEILNSGK